MTTPFFLEPIKPMGLIRLRPKCWAEFRERGEEDEAEDYADFTVWGRRTQDGWTGWHNREHMSSQPIVVWLEGIYEQVE